MQAVIFAGGLGTRISEESHLRPKVMTEIAGMPILWHVMKIYSNFGINDFIICCGYKGFVIKEYFKNYSLHMSDVSISLVKNDMTVHRDTSEPWNITLINTGEFTMTGGRLKRVEKYIDGTFFLTYGDGLSDININDLLEEHQRQAREVTVTAVQPEGRFGALGLNNNNVVSFNEKPDGDGQWVNGGFFVCEPTVFERISGDDIAWENEPLQSLVRDKQLSVYRHNGFWAPLDTLRDKVRLEKLWADQAAPWKVW